MGKAFLRSNLRPDDTFAQAGYLSLFGSSIRYIQKGAGPDVLLLHGTPGSIEDWRAVFDELATGFRVTAFDRPGHGLSTPGTYRYHIEANVRYVERLIDQLDLRAPIIVGHSYGGSIAACMATQSRYPSGHYVILDSPLYHFRPDFIYRLSALPFAGKWMVALAHRTFAAKMMIRKLRQQFEVTPPAVVEALIGERLRIWLSAKAMFTHAREIVHYQRDLDRQSPAYRCISAPVTVVSGRSKSTFYADCKRFCAEVPVAEWVELGHTGHFVQFEKSRQIIDVIKSLQGNG